jgi:hypothetical protein
VLSDNKMRMVVAVVLMIAGVGCFVVWRWINKVAPAYKADQ